MTTPGAALSGGGSPPEEAHLNRPREPLPTDVASLPDLPAAYGDALQAALAALRVALDGDARAAIDAHVRLLLAWNEAINLTAVREPADVAVRHVADSLSALPLIGSAPATLLDIGSGGGFPGLPLAAARTGLRVDLVDSVGKKVRFLEAAAGASGLGARVRAVAARAEALATPAGRRAIGGPAEGWDLVTARAVGPLPDLVELALPLLAPRGRLIAWKRGDIGTELDAAGRAAAALNGSVPAVHEIRAVAGLEGHVLITVTKAGPTPGGYPRDPAARARRAW